MKQSLLLVLVSIPFHPRSNALLYYVSSEHIDNHTCTTSGSTALRPCVSFDLSSNKTFLSNKASVKLLLLSKNYFISQNRTAENIRKLEIFPSGQWEEVSVECEPAVQLYFHRAGGLRMRSLSFTSCTLRYLQGHSNLSTLTVDSCLFTKNALNYAINVSGYSLNVSINNCTFSVLFQLLDTGCFFSLSVHLSALQTSLLLIPYFLTTGEMASIGSQALVVVRAHYMPVM